MRPCTAPAPCRRKYSNGLCHLTLPITKVLSGSMIHFQQLNTKAFAATAARLCVWIAEFKTAANHLIRKIKLGATQIKCAFGIDKNRDAGRPNQYIAPFCSFDKLHFITEPVTTAARDFHPQVRICLFLQHQGTQFFSGIAGDCNQFLSSLAHAFGNYHWSIGAHL